MFRRRSDAGERSSGIGPCQGAPVPDRVHLAQSRGASPDRRIKQITLNRARTLCRAFSCTSECCIAHDARARQHSPAHSSPVEFFRIRTLISVGFVITLLRSSLTSFHLLPSVNIYFDVILFSEYCRKIIFFFIFSVFTPLTVICNSSYNSCQKEGSFG